MVPFSMASSGWRGGLRSRRTFSSIRYVVLLHIGGLFADVDTMPLQPPGAWLQEAMHAATSTAVATATARKDVRLIVGLEAHGSPAEARGWRWAEPTQLAMWATAAAPGHPVMARAAQKYLESPPPEVGSWARAQYDHSIAMGPGLLTRRVDEWIREAAGMRLARLPSVRRNGQHRRCKPASAAGDTVVLGIDGLGCGQLHSGSRPCNASQASLVQHLFFGGWKPAIFGPWSAMQEEPGRRRRRRTPGSEDWRLPALALMAHANSAGIDLPWSAIPLFFSRIVPFEPPLLPAPPGL